MKFRERKTLSGEELAALFQASGLKMTNQRVAVYREVAERCFHPTAEEVYERVRGYLPAISLNTVYRTLTTLIEKGLLRRLEKSNDKAFYDGNTEEHYHFICRRCGGIQDVYIDNVEDLHLIGLDKKVDEVFIQLHGVCNACRMSAVEDAGNLVHAAEQIANTPF